MKRLVVLIAVTVMVAGSSLFLARPADAARNCLSELRQDQCVLECIPNSRKMCAASPEPSLCATDLSNILLMLTQVRAKDSTCAALLAFVRGPEVCDC